MNKNVRALVMGGLAAGAAELLRRMASDGNGDGGKPDRWHMVTINRPLEEVAPGGRLPDGLPLAEIQDQVDITIRPAPADKGTEVGARLRSPRPAGAAEAIARISGNDPLQDLRLRLRQTKSIIECGEVVEPDKRPSTKRTITNLPLELASVRSRGEGRL